MTIKELLQKSVKTLETKKINSAIIDTEILLLDALNSIKEKPKSFRNDRSWLIAHNDYTLTKPQKNKFFRLIRRREKFEPVAYIIGKKEFFGLEFDVNKNVLIPRPETEFIVEESLKDIMDESVIKKEITTIADIGTGSGAIAISLALSLKEKNIFKACKIFASDISSSALKIAKKNAKKHNCSKDITFKKGNLLKAIPKNIKIDYLLANLPYISEKNYQKLSLTKTIPLYRIETDYEPKKALLAGIDGLKYFIEFFREMPEHIEKNAKILLESDPHQIPAIIKLAKKFLPKHKISIIKDLRGLNRITKIEIL
jgi:release factor glutamine methyltransferase